MALADRVSMPVERADFDDLVTLVTQAPTWEKDRAAGRPHPPARDRRRRSRDAPDQILARWTWRLARATRKTQDRRRAQEYPEAKRLLGARRELARAPARGERRAARQGRARAAARRSARRCSRRPRATRRARTSCSTRRARSSGTIQEIAAALAENLPAPKAPARTSRRRRRRKKRPRRRRAHARTQATAAGPASRGASLRPRRARAPRRRRARGYARRDAAARPRLLGRRGRPSPPSSSRSRRNRVSSAASVSPDGSSALGVLDRVGPLLELLDVGRVSGVGGDRLAHLPAYSSARPPRAPSMSIGAPSSVGEAHAERLRRARARRERDVVRHGRPEADRRQPRPAARVVEDADDAGRALVARGSQPELLDERRVGRRRR